MRTVVAALSAAVLAIAVPARAQTAPAPLTVVSAQATGEIASLAEAAEIRVRFSEPMGELGSRIEWRVDGEAVGTRSARTTRAAAAPTPPSP